jgi:hypothetical protein
MNGVGFGAALVAGSHQQKCLHALVIQIINLLCKGLNRRINLLNTSKACCSLAFLRG